MKKNFKKSWLHNIALLSILLFGSVTQAHEVKIDEKELGHITDSSLSEVPEIFFGQTSEENLNKTPCWVEVKRDPKTHKINGFRIQTEESILDYLDNLNFPFSEFKKEGDLFQDGFSLNANKRLSPKSTLNVRIHIQVIDGKIISVSATETEKIIGMFPINSNQLNCINLRNKQLITQGDPQ